MPHHAKRIITFLFISAITAWVVAQPKAEKGVLDLQGYDFSKSGILTIEGEWKFFWEQITNPISEENEGGHFVPVPSAWGQLGDIVTGIRPKGFATYQLKILLPGDVERLALRFTEVFSASGYYINGVNIGFNGFPSANRYQSTFSYAPVMFVFTPKSNEMDLVVHVSNFEHRSGGIRGSVEIGTTVDIMHDRANRQFMDFFLMGAFLIIGIYFMGLYLIRAELYKLFFSLICLMMAFRIFLLSDTAISDSFISNGITRLRLEYLSFDILVPLFVMMIRFIFPGDFPKLLFKIILWICSLMILLVIFSPVSLFSEAYNYYMYFVFLALAVILYTMIIAWVRGRKYAPAFAIGLAIVAIGAINDMLYVADCINTGYISHVMMFVYLVIYAMIFSGKGNHDFKMAEKLSKENTTIREQLEMLVEKRTKELNEKSLALTEQQKKLSKFNSDLQKEINIRNSFFAILGHDIRGPVGYIRQVLEMLAIGQLKQKEAQEMIMLAAESSGAVLNLLENLLAWGRTKTGELTHIVVKFELKPVINDTMSLFRLPLKEKNINLEINISESLSVFADREHVKLIIRNLVSNAVKFTNPGGKVSVNSYFSQANRKVLIEVEDNGIGMSSSQLEAIFSNGETKSIPGTRNEKGTGLGLKLSRELAEMNHGWIKAVSRKGAGSKFSVGLPASEEDL
ncbi:MAG: sensor histidine kinase [Bacteroidales bacterium]|nr:sensor histidine kinase [Bacteroidales bacterium]